MKLSSALVLAATVASAASASVGSTIRKSTSAKAALLSKARRLEDANDGDDAAAEEEYQYLASYSLKLIGCANGEQYVSPEDGEYEYGSVVFRLCPADACDDESSTGCGEGYGDYVVGINTFVDAWLEDKREDMENDQDDQWDMNQFAECREYEVDQDADDEENGDDAAAYYVGPYCTDDGEIAIGFFSDYTCSTVPDDVTFEDISNGWSLPYSDGGLVTNYCESCTGVNDNGEEELSEMCGQLYAGASSKCENDMTYLEEYGISMDQSGCESIAETYPATVASSGSKAGIIIMWVIIALLILGAGFFLYTKWWMKRKQGNAAAAGLSTSDGVAA